MKEYIASLALSGQRDAGQVSAEWVLVLGIVICIAGALILCRDQIYSAIQTAGTNIKSQFDKTTQAAASGGTTE